MQRPSNLIYSVDERPPRAAALLLGLQHVAACSVSWVIATVIVTGIGLPASEAQGVIQVAMIASGVGTLLQARRGLVGSGYLCALGSGPAYVAASLLAGKQGGLAAVFGMNLLAAAFEALLARYIARLRSLFPPEVAGLVVTMVGVELVPLGCARIVDAGGHSHDSFALAVFTLGVMIALSVWGGRNLRLYSALIGIGLGYLAAYAVGVLDYAHLEAVLEAPLASLPRVAPRWSFHWSLVLPFLIAAVSSAVKGIGDLTLCQKINDASWNRPDMKSIRGGLLADAVANLTAGLLGATGQSTYSTSVGLSAATGATSRVIGFAAGGILIALSFLPKLAAVLSVMPSPVMGAALIFAACFMIVGGIQVITSRLLDARKTFVVGVSMIFGLSVKMVPGLYANVPAALHPLVSSSLSLATVLVLVLNPLLRIGIGRRQVLELSPGVDSSEEIFAFLERQGGAWGARKDVISRATAALAEFFELACALELATGPITVVATFDEFDLDLNLSYEGRLVEFPASSPTPDEVLADDRALARLSGFLIAQQVDRIRSEVRDGTCRVQFHFDH